MASEKGLINKQDVIRHLRGDCIGKYPLSYYFGLLAAAGEVEIMPTVDAVEVVHGQWFVIEDDYFDLVELKCSACGESWGFEDYEDCIPQNYHYCPNCGAKMRGSEE